MKAINIAGIGGLDQLVAAEVPLPELGPTDILVNVKAVSVNPVEAKIRAGKWAGGQLPAGSILGFDCAGVISSLGSQVPPNAFSTGEEVWLLGSTVPTHSNAEYVAVDYRVVAPKPKSLSFEDAAAVPLVGLTAWEMIDQTGVGNEPGALLVINGAGGVGSVGIQLAKAKGVKNIIATASRDVSINHVKALGATHTINHREPLKPQIEALNLGEPIKYILVFTNLTKSVLDQAIDVVAPWGHIGLAVQGPPGSYDGLGAGQKKGVSLHWGFVFTRMALKWEMEYQGKALRDMAKLFDEGKLKSITTKTLELTVQGVRDAHTLMEAGETIGKVVLKVPEEDAFQ
ncbi:GroES-like protein [Cyathus striatus]|nr:GroES-like protein [Cyathus striatus]